MYILRIILSLMIGIGFFTPVDSRAETASGIEDTKIQTVFVGQQRHIFFNYNDKVIKSSKVKWKITEGKENVKLVKNGKYIKGLKEGTATITGTYKKNKITITVNVLKSEKIKAKTTIVNNVRIKIPGNYYIINDTDYEQQFMHTKKEISLDIFASQYDEEDIEARKDYSAEDLDEYIKGDLDWIGADIAQQLEYNGVNIKEFNGPKFSDIIENNGSCAWVATWSIKLTNLGTYYVKAVEIVGTTYSIQALAAGYDEKTVNETIDYILKNNNK